eukprot:3044490-Alexandrium_andersonii.AAC.1
MIAHAVQQVHAVGLARVGAVLQQVLRRGHIVDAPREPRACFPGGRRGRPQGHGRRHRGRQTKAELSNEAPE